VTEKDEEHSHEKIPRFGKRTAIGGLRLGSGKSRASSSGPDAAILG
jgi:hypothetical protein